MTIEQAIRQAVALCHGVTEAGILGRTKGSARTCEARRIVMGLLHQAGWTYERIGLYLHRHHSTVLHALKPPNPF